MTELSERRLQLLKELDIVVNIEINIRKNKEFIVNDVDKTLSSVILTKATILQELKLLSLIH